MKNWKQIAREFPKRENIIHSLYNDIMKIPHIYECDFDIYDWYEDKPLQDYVILVVGFNIPSSIPNYFDVYDKTLNDVLKVCSEYHLIGTGDRIENMGQHWYIVRKIKNETWDR